MPRIRPDHPSDFEPDRDLPGVIPSILDSIGNTPLVELSRLAQKLPGRVLLKLENCNPGGSVKDRIALRMVLEAETSGLLLPGGVIVELTSGNTGIGLAMVAAVRGYDFIAVMSEGNSLERRRMLSALGARVELVPQSPDSISGQVSGADLELVERRAAELTAELSAWRPDQFVNPVNPLAHEELTGVEIWEQTGGKVDAWVASIGTGGTFIGVARALKSRNPSIRCVALEPESVRILAGVPTVDPRHKIQGTGYNLVPPAWDAELCEGYLGVTNEAAQATTRRLANEEGILAGYSGGANVWGALQLAKECREGEVIVTVCPDTGSKYLSTDLFP